ncbi:MAG TPA: hypothetical protein VKB76_19020, partial [Ktedonobacterales bacterium]|nr:hypothetical protein [Ktedonobacterales bacterium]
QLAEIARNRSMPGERMWGVSALVAQGLVARGLSIGGHGLDQDLLAFWSAAKRALYGADAVLPRKIR